MYNTVLTFVYLTVIYLSFIFRGSFFQYEQTIFAFALLIIFIIWFIKKYNNCESFIFNYQDGLFLVIILGYIISLINPVDSIGALKEFYLILIYFFVYLMGKNFLYSYKNLFIGFLLILTSFKSIAGLLTYFGCKIPFASLYLSNRIGSLFQYPNTLAAINIVGVVVMLGLILFHKSIIIRVISFMLFITNLLTFILTISRGGLLVFVFIFFIYLLVLPKEKRISYFLYNALGFAIILVYLKGFTQSFGNFEMGTKYLALSLLTAFILFLILDYLIKRFNLSNKKNYLYGIVAITCSLILFTFLCDNLLPENILNRLKDINFSTVNVKLRLNFYEAAFGIIKDHPFGIGGEGWASIYYDYIPNFFIAREVHSHPLQIGVEAGILGMIGFISFSLYTIYIFIKGYYLEHSETRYYYLIMGLSFLALFSHSWIDFDMSYSSVAFLFYALASQVPKTNNFILGFKKYKKIIFSIFLILTVCLVIGLGKMLIGSYYKVHGEDLLDEGEYIKAVSSFEDAIKWIPNDSMSYLYILMFKEDITLNERDQLLEQAYKYNSYKPEIIHYYLKGKMELGQYEEAYRLASLLVKRQPLKENFTLFFDSARYSIKNAINKENMENLINYSQEVLNIYSLSKEYDYNLREVDNLVLGQAYFIDNNYLKAEKQFILARNNNFIKAESEMWLILTYEKLGEIEKSENLFNKPLNRFLPKNDNYLYLKQIF